jgi:hypothetical protein
MRGILVMC